MQQADDEEVFRQLKEGHTLFGAGWRCVESFDEVDDEYEDEEEEYVVMDLGTAMDARTLQTEATYQLIGMDTPMPFLKIGEHIFQGTVAPLVGDEVILDVVRQEDDPQRPHHRPAYKTRNRVELRGITLRPRSIGASEPQPPPQPQAQSQPQVQATPETRKVSARPRKSETEVPDTPTPVAGPSRPSRLRNVVSESKDESEDTSQSTPRSIGRPRGSASRATLPVKNLTDLADIHLAGGLGDIRLEIAEDATPELLAAVSAIRGKASGPGTKLSRAQEARLVRGLPASGPGSRGGRGGRRGGTPTSAGRPRGRPRRSETVHPTGIGLAEEFLGVPSDAMDVDGGGEGEPNGAEEGAGEGAGMGPEDHDMQVALATPPLRQLDSDDELREIDES